jgi:prolyl 4-hydroxylase
VLQVRVPDDAWDLLLTYYEDNKDSPKREAWGAGNIYTNDVEAPSYMVNLPESGPLKPQIFDQLKPILEEWSGVPLTQTACYGIRAYTNGSWLANHVDTRGTHVVSVIINVDQEVTEDWPLLIHDHAGTAHNITMAPRDMVLYESATCVHGRPTKFNGKFYANMFVHYKPTDPAQWSG